MTFNNNISVQLSCAVDIQLKLEMVWAAYDIRIIGFQCWFGYEHLPLIGQHLVRQRGRVAIDLHTLPRLDPTPPYLRYAVRLLTGMREMR